MILPQPVEWHGFIFITDTCHACRFFSFHNACKYTIKVGGKVAQLVER